MTRFEENMTVINEINELVRETEPMPLNANEQMVVQVSIIATILTDISKSLAILADDKVEIEGNENERN